MPPGPLRLVHQLLFKLGSNFTCLQDTCSKINVLNVSFAYSQLSRKFQGSFHFYPLPPP